MTNEHDDILAGLERLGEADRDATPPGLARTIGGSPPAVRAARGPLRGPVLARIAPWALAAAAVGITATLLLQSTPAPTHDDRAAIEAALDPGWLFGDEFNALDSELTLLARSLDDDTLGTLSLDMIGDDL